MAHELTHAISHINDLSVYLTVFVFCLAPNSNIQMVILQINETSSERSFPDE